MKESALIGTWQSDVDNMFQPNIRPQECGNHEDTRWASFTDGKGAGLKVTGIPLFGFAAYRHTFADLTSTRHPCDLPQRDEIMLLLDHRQCGVGAGSLGPDVMEKYRIPAAPFAFSMLLAPVD